MDMYQKGKIMNEGEAVKFNKEKIRQEINQ